MQPLGRYRLLCLVNARITLNAVYIIFILEMGGEGKVVAPRGLVVHSGLKLKRAMME